MKLPELATDEKTARIFAVLQAIIFEDNLFVRIQAIDTVINMLDYKLQKKTMAIPFQKWLHNILDDNEFNRKIRLVSKFSDNIEASIEYFSGQEFITTPELNYDPELNEKVNKINKSINKFIGIIIKELNVISEIEL